MLRGFRGVVFVERSLNPAGSHLSSMDLDLDLAAERAGSSWNTQQGRERARGRRAADTCTPEHHMNMFCIFPEENIIQET